MLSTSVCPSVRLPARWKNQATQGGTGPASSSRADEDPVVCGRPPHWGAPPSLSSLSREAHWPLRDLPQACSDRRTGMSHPAARRQGGQERCHEGRGAGSRVAAPLPPLPPASPPRAAQPPGRGQCSAAGTPRGGPLRMGRYSVIWPAKRPGGERKMPRGEDIQKQKTGLGFEGKGRKFSGFSCTSLSPPSTASSN